MKCIRNETERSDTDLRSTCLNSESKWGTPCVSIQGIQANRVCGAWLQTLEKQQQQKKNTVKQENTKITLPKLKSVKRFHLFKGCLAGRCGVPVRV